MIAAGGSTRAENGLPDDAFVFCCFNNSFKITPQVFDSWMRILAQAPGSVLWLFSYAAPVERNLRAAAKARGIDPQRLVFARTLPLPEHLARHRAADLFLDTLPYNAHTTASDALWAGLPVLTLMGETFASRVAASLLTAAGVPELIAPSRAEYESMAVGLYKDKATLQALRSKIEANRLNCALFDPALYTRNLETLFEGMVARQRKGLPPDHLFA
jgi:predicted O-linked N-acetylglucosamine transferase (SPINDLY family)